MACKAASSPEDMPSSSAIQVAKLMPAIAKSEQQELIDPEEGELKITRGAENN